MWRAAMFAAVLTALPFSAQAQDGRASLQLQLECSEKRQAIFQRNADMFDASAKRQKTLGDDAHKLCIYGRTRAIKEHEAGIKAVAGIQNSVCSDENARKVLEKSKQILADYRVELREICKRAGI